MTPGDIEADPRVIALRKKFPNAYLAEVRDLAACAIEFSGERLSYQDLSQIADNERARAERVCNDAIVASTDLARSEAEREAARHTAVERRRLADAFSAIVKILESARTDWAINARLREIAADEARDAAERAAEARDAADENNAS
jgi:hypothetical protein